MPQITDLTALVEASLKIKPEQEAVLKQVANQPQLQARNLLLNQSVLSLELQVAGKWQQFALPLARHHSQPAVFNATQIEKQIKQALINFAAEGTQINIKPDGRLTQSLAQPSQILQLVSLLAKQTTNHNTLQLSATLSTSTKGVKQAAAAPLQLYIPALKTHLPLSDQAAKLIQSLPANTQLQVSLAAQSNQTVAHVHVKEQKQALFNIPLSTNKLVQLISKGAGTQQLQAKVDGQYLTVRNSSASSTIQIPLTQSTHLQTGGLQQWQPLTLQPQHQLLQLQLKEPPVQLQLAKPFFSTLAANAEGKLSASQASALKTNDPAVKVNPTQNNPLQSGGNTPSKGAAIPTTHSPLNADSESISATQDTSLSAKPAVTSTITAPPLSQIQNIQTKESIAQPLQQLIKLAIQLPENAQQAVLAKLANIISENNLSSEKLRSEVLSQLAPGQLKDITQASTLKQGLYDIATLVIASRLGNEMPLKTDVSRPEPAVNQTKVDQLLQALFPMLTINKKNKQQWSQLLSQRFVGELSQVQQHMQQGQQQVVQQQSEHSFTPIHLLLPFKVAEQIKETEITLGQYKKSDTKQHETQAWFIKLNFDLGEQGKIQTFAELVAKSVSCSFLSESQALLDKARTLTQVLNLRLQAHGLNIDKMKFELGQIKPETNGKYTSIISLKV